MSALELQHVRYRELASVSALLTGGTYVVLGGSSDGAAALIELAAGIVAPSWGRVLLDGKAPFANPETRRRSAALCAEERLPPMKTVTAALELLLRARGSTRSADSVLDDAGLSWLRSRRSQSLSAREARAVALALALALAQEDPLLLALFEPLGLIGLVHEAYLRESLAHASRAGSVVLTTATRLEDAAVIEGSLSVLERGAWLGSSALRAPASAITLRVRSSNATQLAALLTGSEEITALEALGMHELLARGRDPERIAERVLACARAASIQIEALCVDAPSLSELAAARERATRAEQQTLRAYAARPIFYGAGPES